VIKHRDTVLLLGSLELAPGPQAGIFQSCSTWLPRDGCATDWVL